MSKGQSIFETIRNIDRPGRARAEGLYANADSYTKKQFPEAGANAEAGVGRAGAQWSIFQAEAKGPNATAGAKANPLEASAMARAEVGSASASAGPVGVTVGLGVDTGVSVGPTHAELKVLGTGFKFGRTMGISVLGNELSFKLW